MDTPTGDIFIGRVPVPHVFANALKEDLTDALVIGYKEDGSLYFSGSNPYTRLIIKMLEEARSHMPATLPDLPQFDGPWKRFERGRLLRRIFMPWRYLRIQFL